MLTVYPTERGRGVLRFEGREYPCVLGRNGVQKTKLEGDGATPSGTYLLRRVFFRPDRLPPPASGLPVAPLAHTDGWCDDPSHRDYNRLVRLPFSASHEALWRDDNLYDVIIVIGHNDDPPHPGLGSAIFIHCATANFSSTDGCVALACETLIELVPRFAPGAALRVMDNQGAAP